MTKNYKYFTGYLYSDYNVKLLYIMFPKTRPYVKYYDGKIKWLYFLIEDGDLLEKYNAIWDNVSADVKREFDGEPVYNKNFFKTKTKSYGN